MPKKKALKGVFHDFIGGSFSQKKKIVFGNVKHSGNKKDIFLSKYGSGNNVYSNMNSLFGNDEDVSITNMNSEFLLGLAAIISKAKCINTSTGFGFLLSSPNFYMDDNEVVFLSYLSIFLDKKLIDPKIIKTLVEVLVKKLFVLNINLLAVEGKSATFKTQLIRKLFSLINSFGGATTSSKFEKIIKSTFTSDISMKKTTLLVKKNRIFINVNVKKQEMYSELSL
ncbi:hypothetical protein G9A89_022556 [Geosiphon pyriformis]|nr:hypothetical protein G9A89_022556 [Geosiphon pyriformis]